MKNKLFRNMICLSVCSMMAMPVPLYAKTKPSKKTTVAVKKSKSKKKKISLNYKKLKISVGKTKKLKLKNYKGKIRWSTSNKKTVTVSKNGKVKAIKAGKANITAKAKKKIYTCKVTVFKKKNSQKINDTKAKNNKLKKTSQKQDAVVPENENIKIQTNLSDKKLNNVYFRCPFTFQDPTVLMKVGITLSDNDYKNLSITLSNPEVVGLSRDDSKVTDTGDWFVGIEFIPYKEGNTDLTIKTNNFNKTYKLHVTPSALYNLIYSRVEPLINGINSSNLTDAEKAFVLYMWISNNILYASPRYPYNKSIDSTILDKRGLCSEQSMTYSWLLSLVGIKSRIIGTTGHEFNQIEIDGEWYNADVICKDAEHFLKSDFYMPSDDIYPLFNSPQDGTHNLKSRKHCTLCYYDPSADNNYSANSIKYDNYDWSKVEDTLEYQKLIKSVIITQYN